MTLAQIEKTREFLLKVDTCKNYHDMKSLEGEVRNYYDKQYTAQLKINGWYENYNDCIEMDKLSLKSFLHGLLDGNNVVGLVCRILDLLDEAGKCNKDKIGIAKMISKIYHGYSDKISFDETIKLIANAPDDAIRANIIIVNDSILQGLLIKLKNYANNVLTECPVQSNSVASVVISPTINTNANATAINNVDFSIFIEHARQQVEEAGLSDSQHQAVMDKLSEIEEIAKSKDSKGKRWTKAKEILKWVAEQGITVAGIVLPLLAPMIG